MELQTSKFSLGSCDGLGMMISLFSKSVCILFSFWEINVYKNDLVFFIFN